MRIDWEDLNQKLNYKCKFLVIVNYLVPLDLNQAIEFADKNNLILIEDIAITMVVYLKESI